MTDIERQQIEARIDRDLAESAKLREETRLFVLTQHARIDAETAKFRAEARKYRWDPLLVVVGAIIAGVFFRLDLILRVLHLSG